MNASSKQDSTFEFDAFASYSTDPDYRLVRQTESFLESFHKRVASTSAALNALKICVDGSDFRVSSRGGSLSADDADPVSKLIFDNLAKSRRLILFCSAKAAQSRWVEQEILWFLEHRGPDSVLLVVTEGNAPGKDPEECIPAAAIAAGLHQKPWYDLRQARPASKKWVKVKELTDERVRLAAHLNDRSAGEILPLWRREERRRQRRRQWITSVVAAVLLVLATAATWFGINAERQRRLAVARLLAAQSDARLDSTSDGLQQSLLLATESLKSAWTAEGYASWARAILLPPRHPRPLLNDGTLVLDLDPHPARSWLAMAGADGVVRIINQDAETILQELPFLDRDIPEGAQWLGAIVRFSPDGMWLAAAAEFRLSVWNTQNWERRDFEVATEGYFDLAFDRTSGFLAVCGYSQALQIFETQSWTQVRPPQIQDGIKLRALDFSDTHLVTAERSGDIVLWRLGGKRFAVEALRIDSGGDAIHDVQALPGSMVLAIARESGVQFWPSSATERALDAVTLPEKESGIAQTPRISADDIDSRAGSWRADVPPAHRLVFSPDGTQLLSAAQSRVEQFDTAVRLWDTKTGRELARIHPGGPAAFLPGGELAIGGEHAAAWPIPQQGSVVSLSYASEPVSIAFSPDGQWLAAGLADSSLVLRQTGSWDKEIVLQAAGPVDLIGFTVDGRKLIVGSHGKYGSNPATLQMFDTRTWNLMQSQEHEADFSIFASPDARYLRTFTPNWEDRYEGLKRASRSRVWDISTGREIAWRSEEKRDRSMTGKISIAEGTLPLGQEGDQVLIEQSADWTALRPFSGGVGRLNRTRRGPLGHWLAGFGGGARQGLVLLEPGTGRELVNFQPKKALIADAAFSPDGHWLAAAEGTSLHIWLLGPVNALIDESCNRLTLIHSKSQTREKPATARLSRVCPIND